MTSARYFIIALLLLPLFAENVQALDKDDLTLVFEDDFESGLSNWELMNPDAWRIEREGESGNHVLSLFVPGGIERDFHAPRSVAMVKDFTAGDFIVEARLRHRGEPYGHQDLCVLYNVQDDYQFYYTHLAPVADDGANTIFIVHDSERRSIAAERSDGTVWGEEWHDLRIVRDTQAATIEVYFDDMTTPIMRAVDDTFTGGRIGVGSYNDVGWFDDVKIWARPDLRKDEAINAEHSNGTPQDPINNNIR